MKEKDYNSILVKSLREIGWHVHKIPDIGSFGEGNNRFTMPRPYDIFAFGNDGYSFAFEGKILKPKCKALYCSFNLKAISEHQIKNLIDAASRIQCASFIALYVWKLREISQVIFIPIRFITEHIEKDINISAEELETISLKYNCKKSLFQFDKLFESELYNNFREKNDK